MDASSKNGNGALLRPQAAGRGEDGYEIEATCVSDTVGRGGKIPMALWFA